MQKVSCLVNEFTYHTPGNSLKLQYKNAPEENGVPLFFTGKKEEWIILKKQIRFHFGYYRTFMHLQSNELPQVQLMRRDSSLSILLNKKNKCNKWEQVNIPLLHSLVNDS